MSSFEGEGLHHAGADQQRRERLELAAKAILEKKMDEVRVGDATIEPWKLMGLHDERPSSEIFHGEEICDPKERNLIIEEAVTATREILQAFYSIGPDTYYKNFTHLCARASAMTQELLGYAQVRTVLVFGTYHAKRSQRYIDDVDKWYFQDQGDYGHFWLYASSTGIIPMSDIQAQHDLIIIDPTRDQFHPQKPMIVHNAEGKYTPLISRFGRRGLDKDNKWLWNEEELRQWVRILKELK